MAQRSFTAPRAILEVAGKRLGWVQQVAGQETHQHMEVRELGSYWAVEIEGLSGACAGSVSRLRILGRPLARDGLEARGDGTEFVTFAGLDMVLRDQVGDFAVKRVKGMRWESKSWSMAVQGAMSEDATWIALRVYDEDLTVEV